MIFPVLFVAALIVVIVAIAIAARLARPAHSRNAVTMRQVNPHAWQINPHPPVVRGKPKPFMGKKQENKR